MVHQSCSYLKLKGSTYYFSRRIPKPLQKHFKTDCVGEGAPLLLTYQFQPKPCRCSYRIASIIERIDLGYASDLMRVLIKLTATSNWKRVLICLKHSLL